jgi:hypothetical protein
MMRLLSPAIAILPGALGFAVGWLPLKFHAVLWSSLAPKAMGFLCLAFFYAFSIGGLLNAVGYPFMAAELETEGITLAHHILMIPACVGAAAGAHRVYLDHVVVQQAHARDVRNARA